MEKILPGGISTSQCRVRTHLIFTIGDSRQPLAIYKEVGLEKWDAYHEIWEDYHIETRSNIEKSRQAAKDLRAIYLDLEFLFAWQYCNDLGDEQQLNHWYLLRVANQMMFKANMQDTLLKRHRVYNIFAFDNSFQRTNCPMESDYAATLGCGYQKDPDVDKLQLHGKYKDEYNLLTL